MAQVFLSYAREDEEKVESLYQRLSDAGFKPWMDKKDILPGERWKDSIQGAIRSSDFVLVCLSAHSVNKRGFLQKEIRLALDIWGEKLDSDIYLIPVRLDDCEVPENLRDFQWVNLFEEDGWTRLVQAIRVGMKRRAEVPADEEPSSGREMATPQEGPERIKKMERLADEIRKFAYENYIKPARERGEKQITIRAGDVHKEMRLVSRIPAVCSALGTIKFRNMCGIELISREGPTNGSNVYFTFKLVRQWHISRLAFRQSSTGTLTI